MEPNSFIYKYCQYYVNQVIPQDAILLKRLYKENGEQSKLAGWEKIHTSILIPRLLKGPLTIPVALLDAGTYTAQGLFKASIEILDGNLNNATTALTHDLSSALQCLAVTVASIAYAAIGLVWGSAFYSQFIPQAVKKETPHETTIASLEKKIKSLELQLASISSLKDDSEEVQRLKKSLEKSQKKIEKFKNQYVTAQEANIKIVKDKQQLHSQLVNQTKCFEQNLEEAKKLANDHQKAISSYNEIKLQRNYLAKKYFQIYQEHEKLKNPQNPQTQISLSNSMIGALSQSSILTLTENTSLSTPVNDKPASTPVNDKPASRWDYLAGTLFNAATKANTWIVQPALHQIVLPAISTGRQYFRDGQDPWKNHRYDVILEQIQQVFGAEEIEALQSLQDLNNSKGREVLKNLQMALSALTSPELYEVRKQKKVFQESIRTALRILQNDKNHGVPKDLENRIYALCGKWMTSIEMNPFNYQMSLYVASKGNPKILDIVNNPQAPLQEKIEGMLTGIAKANQKYKAPTAHLLAAKMEVIKESYDPLLKDNTPSKIATMVYQNEKGNQRTIQEYRTGVPIGPRSTDRKQGDKPWEMEGISAVPEILGFLNDLKAKNLTKKDGEPKEKLLMILHLNPHHYNTDRDELRQLSKQEQEEHITWMKTQFEDAKHVSDSLDINQREARWIKLFRKLSLHSDYKDVLSVALVPMDGDWLKKDIEHCSQGKTLTELHNHLIKVLTQENSPYIIPNMNKAEKTQFISNILAGTANQYFASFIGDTFTLNKTQMLAFIGLFNGQLAEALQIKEKATYVQRNCKDAIDRTIALVAAELLDRYLRLGLLYVQNNLENILGTICGPALGIAKREVLKERQPILLAVASYFDALKKDNIKIGPAPTFEGYSLAEIHMGADQYQTLYPTPSSAKEENDYIHLLAFEQEHPFAVSHQFKIPFLFNEDENDLKDNNEKLSEICSDINDEFFEILKQRYNHSTLHYQVLDISKDTQIIKNEEILSIQKSFMIHHADDRGGKEIIRLKGEISINLAEKNAQFNYSIA